MVTGVRSGRGRHSRCQRARGWENRPPSSSQRHCPIRHRPGICCAWLRRTATRVPPHVALRFIRYRLRVTKSDTPFMIANMGRRPAELRNNFGHSVIIDW